VLTPAEAAFLAALPQQPSRYNPWKDPQAARRRQERILTTMALEGWLDAETYQAATRERLTLRREAAGSIAPHFVERVMADTVPGASRRIITTLDATLQRTVQGIIAAHREELETHHADNIAVAVLDNRRGEWLAWEGSGNYFDATDGGAIDGVVAPRQPGSALKPFTYAAAFERDHHPGTVLPDVPSQFPTAEPGILYSPRNYDGRFRGPLLARVALAGSENVPAVAIASEIGVPSVARVLRRLGLTTLDRNAAHYGLGLTLGNAEVRLDELVTAYSVLARGGTRVTPRRILTVDDERPGTTLGTAEPAAVERVLSERTAFWITDILSDSEARAYIFGRGGSLEFPFPVAAKTGTSQAYHDNWAIGYTRDVTVGVWVGNFDRTPLRGSSGVTGAGPVFHDVMLAAVERVTGTQSVGSETAILPPTADSRRATLCAVSGMAATQACARRVSEWVPSEREIETCTWHHHSDRGLVTAWPREYEYWARHEGLWQDATTSYATTPASSTSMTPVRGTTTTMSTAQAAAPAAPSLTIVAPLPGATYLIDPTLRAEFQTLPLRATGTARDGSLEWFVNGSPVGTSSIGGTIRWRMARGTHAITVLDAEGRSAETRIEIR
jgi:penicillin-binding protein 1C